VLANDIELLYPAVLGNDLVLTPHTYILNGATVITGELVLNAENNEDSLVRNRVKRHNVIKTGVNFLYMRLLTSALVIFSVHFFKRTAFSVYLQCANNRLPDFTISNPQNLSRGSCHTTATP